MTARRVVVSAVLLVTACTGAGFAASAGAAVDCTNPGPLCAPYDTAKAATAGALGTAVADCAATFDSTPCPQLATVGGTVYNDVFFPYEVCYHAYPVTSDGCIGPIE